jgi:hypothetical protein
MNKRILADIMRTALDYLPRHPQFHYYPVYSFIIQDNSIIEWSINACGEVEGPLKNMYEARVAHLDGKSKLHAEPRAYAKAKGLLQREKAFEVANVRLNRIGRMRMAAPCSCCSSFLHNLNCSNAYFTTDAGWAKLAMR